jgi:phospholipid N-methyltransferase
LGRRNAGGGPTLLSYFHFLWAGLAKQGQTGAIVPSQRFLIAKMIAPVPEDYEGEIVELGAGTGAFTLPLAARCPAARVLACELNPVLAQHCRERLKRAGLHRRATVAAAPAEQVLGWLRERGRQPDYVLSGIPLGNFSREKVFTLITAIHQTLRDGGLYIQYQHSLLDRKKIRNCFSSLRVAPVLLNFPPAVVYYARK